MMMRRRGGVAAVALEAEMRGLTAVAMTRGRVIVDSECRGESEKRRRVAAREGKVEGNEGGAVPKSGGCRGLSCE